MAVIGKVHRLGLSGRITHHRNARRLGPTGKRISRGLSEARKAAKLAQINGRRRLRGAAPVASFAEHAATEARLREELLALLSEPDIVVPLDERRGILVRNAKGQLCANDAMDATACRWPIGDPQSPDFHFCNGKKTAGSGLPYCPHHCARAYQPPQPPSRLPNPLHSSAPQMTGRILALAEFDATETVA
jgi:GcrA cell cycle regulator